MFTDQELIKAVEKTNCVSQVITLLGRANVGTNYKLIRKRISALSIDTSHWGKKNVSKLKLNNDSIFVEHSPVPRSVIRNRIITHKLLPLVCAICGTDPVWRDKPLSLILDHINGIRDDNRFENIRFLCPNCNSQTDTFAGRNGRTRVQKFCECGNIKSYRSKTCKSCAMKKLHSNSSCHKSKIKWPSKKAILTMIEDYGSYRQVGFKLGVSDNAIRKHLKKS